MVLAAMCVVATPAAVAQTPVTDQYQVDDGGTAPADDAGAAPGDAGVAPAEDAGTAPVAIAGATPPSGTLPFTGAQISLIALIGLGLVALGALGVAAARRRDGSTTP